MLQSLAGQYPEKTFYLGQVFKDTTNSYKLVWFLSILELIRRPDSPVLSFSDVLTEMAVTAWHPVCLFRLSLGRQDKLQAVVLDIRRQSNLPANATPEQVRDFVGGSVQARSQLESFRRFVPTRFLAPWFADKLRGQPDSKRGRLIEALARDSQSKPLATPYWLDSSSLRLNTSWRRFLRENVGVVQAFAEHHFTLYLQARNPNVPGIVNKLSAPTQRDLKLARDFWLFVRNRFQEAGKSERFCDIYSEKPIIGKFAVDHFLPWSFVAHDLLWNLAPVETATNSSKGDTLPDLEKYLPRLVSLHAGAIEAAREKPKLLADYTEAFKLDVPGLLALGEDGLRGKYRGMMDPQVQIATNQGFQAGWKLPSLILLSGSRQSVSLEPPAQDRYQRPPSAPTIIVERFSTDAGTKPSPDHLPFFSMAIAAGGFLAGDALAPEGYVNVRTHGYAGRVSEEMFVTQVVGKSMEPTIHDGAYCVFRRGVSGTRQGRVVLVQKRNFTDPETGGCYTVKRYYSTKRATGEGWEHETIRLVPDNPDRQRFQVLEFTRESEDDLDARIEFVSMLEPPSAPETAQPQ